MFQITQSTSATISIESIEVTLETFRKVVFIDRIGGGLPIMELTLDQYGFHYYEILDKCPIINVSIGSSIGTQMKAEYKVKDYNFVGSNVVISAILSIPDHTKIGDQVFYEGNFTDAVKELSIESDVRIDTDDEQVWIRDGGTSEWVFVGQSIMNAFIAEDDVVYHGYTVDGELIIDSLKEALKNEEYYTFTDDMSSGSESPYVRIMSKKIESNKSLWDETLGNRSLPVFHIVDREVVPYKSYLADESCLPFPQLTDCGNCHDNYYQALINHLSIMSKWSSNSFYVNTPAFIEIDKIKLGARVKMELKKSESTTLASPLNGDYIVAERFMAFTIGTSSTRFNIVRGSHADQSK